MRNFYFNQQKQNQHTQHTKPQTNQPKSIETSIPTVYNRQMLTRNIQISQPIFSVSAIFGLKQGSCRSCGH